MVYRLCDYRPVKEAQKLLCINWIFSYCVYAMNSLEVDLALECRLAFFLELLQCRNVIHVTQSRDYEARLANLTLE